MQSAVVIAMVPLLIFFAAYTAAVTMLYNGPDNP